RRRRRRQRRRRRVGPCAGRRDERGQEPAMSTAEALPSAEELKLCCASAYQRDAVVLILGDSYHPGGLDLTRRLVRSLELRPGDRVLDVASGPGTTAFLLASEFGVEVDGVDLGDLTVAKANATAASEGLGDRARLHAGAGLTVLKTESHDDALARMVEQIDARLVAFRMAKLPALAGVDFDLARERTAQAARAVRDGIAGYSLLVATKEHGKEEL